jgi:DNA anti-recombination protein RmuC
MTSLESERLDHGRDEAEFLFAKLSSLESEVERLRGLESEVERLKSAIAAVEADNRALEDMLEGLQKRFGASGEFKKGGFS